MTFDRLHGTQDVRDNYGWIAYTRRIGDGTYFENKILITTLIYIKMIHIKNINNNIWVKEIKY